MNRPTAQPEMAEAERAKSSEGADTTDRETLLELYKLHVQMADKASDRRLKANAFYVSLTVGILVLAPRFGWLEMSNRAQTVGLILIAVLGLLVCGVWRANVSSFQRLNRAKFQVIDQLEQRLPFRGYELEWRLLGSGGKGHRYLELTRLERILPAVVAVPFLVLIGIAVLSLLASG